jgi:hypothetical protein
MRQSLIRKLAISVTTNIGPETGFVAGFPVSPPQAITRGEVLAVPRRMPKTLSLKTEGTVPLAIAEGAREEVEALSRKFGADQAFIQGFLFEINKDAGALDWIRARLSKPKAEILTMNVREKAIPMSQPISPAAGSDAYTKMDPVIKKLEARRAKGRTTPQ